MKLIKIGCAGLLFLFALGYFLEKVFEPNQSRVKNLPLVLRSDSRKTITVAADRERFRLIAQIGALYNYIHSRPNSKEDQRDLARSAQMAAYIQATMLERSARKNGLLLDITVNTPCEEIQRLKFRETGFTPSVVGVQIRIREGPHNGFEGWVFESQIGH